MLILFNLVDNVAILVELLVGQTHLLGWFVILCFTYGTCEWHNYHTLLPTTFNVWAFSVQLIF